MELDRQCHRIGMQVKQNSLLNIQFQVKDLMY